VRNYLRRKWSSQFSGSAVTTMPRAVPTAGYANTTGLLTDVPIQIGLSCDGDGNERLFLHHRYCLLRSAHKLNILQKIRAYGSKF
jgi:hypothetical protein